MFTYLDTVNKYYPANKITPRDENNISFDFWRGGSGSASNNRADTVGQILKERFINSNYHFGIGVIFSYLTGNRLIVDGACESFLDETS